MTDDLQERAREVLSDDDPTAEWFEYHYRQASTYLALGVNLKQDGWQSLNYHIQKMREGFRLAFASPTPEPSGAVVEAERECLTFALGALQGIAESCPHKVTAEVARQTDLIIGEKLASLDAGSASS